MENTEGMPNVQQTVEENFRNTLSHAWRPTTFYSRFGL